ncbi:hypothetical protein WDW86_21285 [Bdellovibrionota bacterium FG-2]
MNKNILGWILAIAITLSAAAYQRFTGPTYPLRGAATVAGKTIAFQLPRSHGGEGDQEVKIDDLGQRAFLIYRRYKTQDEFAQIDMKPDNSKLVANLPHQPPAGKLEYNLLLEDHGNLIPAVPNESVVIRFKGAVPPWVLVPHIIFMFLAMLLSNRTGIEALLKGDEEGNRMRTFAIMTTATLFVGGMILGPCVQKYAFGEFWTGIPWGWDLTDNKTLVGMIGWFAALAIVLAKPSFARVALLGAALLLLGVYSIPHSMKGSELDYSKGKIVTGQ